MCARVRCLVSKAMLQALTTISKAHTTLTGQSQLGHWLCSSCLGPNTESSHAV